MFREDRINDFLNGRTFMALMGVVLVVLSFVASATGNFIVNDDGNGIFVKLSDFGFSSMQSLLLNIVCNIGIVAMLVWLNYLYNFIRALTFVHASAFMLLQIATPFTLTHLYVGTTLAVVLLSATFILFDTYQQHETSQRRIFMAFVLIAAASMFHYVFLGLIPVMVIGFMQLRAMNFKGFLAMGLGLITPFWIVLGLGIFTPADFDMPSVTGIWKALQQLQGNLVIITAVGTAVLAIVLSVVNEFSIFSYRLELRLYNAFFLMVMVIAIAAMAIDYRHTLFYLPILNICLSIQVAHAFTISNGTHRHVLLLALIAASFTLYGVHLTTAL